MIVWTRRETLIFIGISLAPTIFYDIVGLTWLQLPWLPIALIGTAVAFIIGFRNNVTYDRIWEARKIWGGMVNASRSWGMMINDVVTNEYAKDPSTEEEPKAFKMAFIYRHIAWLTSLRHAMRQSRPWEEFLEHKTNREWADKMHIPERESTVEEDLKPLLSQQEYEYALQKTNKATAIIFLQSKQLRILKEQGIIWEFSFLELENILKGLFELQGKTERIKNFPLSSSICNIE